MGGAVSRVPESATAFAHRTQRFFVAVINVWLDPADDPQVHQSWTESLFARIRPSGRGAYVNFLKRKERSELTMPIRLRRERDWREPKLLTIRKTSFA
ncbi:MAG: hypothetical protein R2839_12035 [Thermomicrobiales bacterium]